MTLEISGNGFLYDSAATVPFFREGGISDALIIEQLERIKVAYEAKGATVDAEQWQAVMKFYALVEETKQDA